MPVVASDYPSDARDSGHRMQATGFQDRRNLDVSDRDAQPTQVQVGRHSGFDRCSTLPATGQRTIAKNSRALVPRTRGRWESGRPLDALE